MLVSRISADPMRGGCTVQILDRFNDVLGMGNCDNTTPLKYRAVAFVAIAPYTISNLILTIPENSAYLSLFATAAQPTQPGGAPITDEETAPAGVWTPGSR